MKTVEDLQREALNNFRHNRSSIVSSVNTFFRFAPASVLEASAADDGPPVLLYVHHAIYIALLS